MCAPIPIGKCERYNNNNNTVIIYDRYKYSPLMYTF